MGDRSGLTYYDRTNGYEGSSGYTEAKKSKLADQNEEIRNALIERHKSLRSDIFKGISIHVNGKTNPTADELKRLILLNGGQYDPKMYRTTKFMVATNLSFAKTKSLKSNDKVVRPQWITDSIAVKCLLPYTDYQLFSLTSKTNDVIDIDYFSEDSKGSNNFSERPSSYADSNTSSYKPKQSKQKSIFQREAPKSLDIRQMFSKLNANKEKNKPS